MAQQPNVKDAQPTFSWPCLLGYYWELLVDPEKGKPYECGICHLLARQVVELICAQHLEDESSDDEIEMGVYCQNCLESYLKSHGNKCPVGNHPNPKYQNAVTTKRSIAKLHVKCPRSLQQQLKAT